MRGVWESDSGETIENNHCGPNFHFLTRNLLCPLKMMREELTFVSKRDLTSGATAVANGTSVDPTSPSRQASRTTLEAVRMFSGRTISSDAPVETGPSSPWRRFRRGIS